jgi:hypothetical protein
MSNEKIDKSEDNHEIMAMGDNTPISMTNAPPIVDPSFRDGFSVNAQLADFLKRPVLIHTATWTEGSSINEIIKPWFLYFNKDSIKRKIQNYGFINCNLKLRVVVNASPFYYGYAIGVYQPMFGQGYNPGVMFNSIQSVGAFMAASCRQRIDILPSRNQGGEMLLPFIWPANWLKVGSASNFQTMGEFVISSTDVLYNANSTVGTSVTLQVFAWAEDVVVSAPTSELPLQTDEYKKVGKISSLATSVADVMDMAVGAVPPLLKPYALATSIGARGVSAIASIFGFTNVPVIDDVTGFKNLPFHGISSSEISTPQEKLTLDPKNELTIDNRLAGGNGTDELAIQYLCSKKNIFSLRNWLSTDAPGDIISVINVTPNLSLGRNGIYIPSVADPCYHPPMTLVAKNFNYWRGTMVYRFKFICSQYHRGRIAVLWDPVHGSTGDFDYTTNYSRVIDLAESEIIIKVPFMQPTSHLKVNFNPELANITSGTATIATFSEDNHNGRLILKVLTNQTSPVSSADVLVYAEVSMEDADFAAPLDPQQIIYGSYLEIQSEETSITVKECNIADVEIKAPNYLHSVYMGEKISSMRALMRRRSFYRSLVGPSDAVAATAAIWTPLLTRKPLFAGFEPATSTDTANKVIGVGTSSFNYVNELVSNMFAPCFVGERGSYNYDFNCSTNASSGVDNLSVSRSYYTPINYSILSLSYTALSSRLDKVNAVLDGLSNIGKNGSGLVNQKTQSGLSVQAPFYSRYRFTNTNPTQRFLGTSFDDSNKDFMMATINQPAINNATIKNFDRFSYEVYCGVGTDYQLLYFVNVPSIWYYTTRPSP